MSLGDQFSDSKGVRSRRAGRGTGRGDRQGTRARNGAGRGSRRDVLPRIRGSIDTCIPWRLWRGLGSRLKARFWPESAGACAKHFDTPSATLGVGTGHR